MGCLQRSGRVRRLARSPAGRPPGGEEAPPGDERLDAQGHRLPDALGGLMAEQYGFYITIEGVEQGDFDTAFKAALDRGRGINDAMLDEAQVVVTETGETLFKGIPNGVYCEGCRDHTIPGVRWPTATD